MSFNPRQDIGSPTFTYDRVYQSKDEMLEKISTDYVAIGRYVFILYPRKMDTDNNMVIIQKPEGKDTDGYWDTAIFQKQYDAITNTETYVFITYLSIAEKPLHPSSLVMTNQHNNLVYNTIDNQNEDNWIIIQYDDENIGITHKLNTDPTDRIKLTPTVETVTDGINLILPVLSVDSTGHIVIKDETATLPFTNIASLTVERFDQEDSE